jgi:3',5'-nucleoside bisphosphate phosphatase
VRVVAGCEFSVRAPWGELHLLGYFLPTDGGDLHRFLVEARAARERRGRQMIERLQRLGIEIDLEDLAFQVGNSAVGRPHVARALVDAGAVEDFTEAFDRYLGRGRPAFVEKALPALRQVADIVHGVGGLVVAAHLGEHGREAELRAFRDEGLDGVEVRHPSHPRRIENRLTKLAQRLDLAISGGSDWHGEDQAGLAHAPLGGMEVPEAWLEALERRQAAHG